MGCPRAPDCGRRPDSPAARPRLSPSQTRRKARAHRAASPASSVPCGLTRPLRSGLPHAIRQSNSGDPKAVATFHSAGRHLALSYVSVASLLRLQRVVVAGPLGAAQPFMDGFQDVFHETYRNSPPSAPDICRSKISYLQATEFMALSHFVFDKKASLPSARWITEFEIGSR